MVKCFQAAKILFLAIPEIENNMFETERLQIFKNTPINGTELRRLFKNNPGQYANILLFQLGSGESKRIFGGYASQSWDNSDGTNFGTESSFLFLLKPNEERHKLRVNPSPPNGVKTILWHNGNNQLGFGAKDLILEESVILNYLGKMEI